jgi:Leucine-rich repeat (LRR) protein
VCAPDLNALPCTHAHTRAHTDLNAVGQGIADASLLAECPGIEVLSLSVHKLASLRHFIFCNKLTQLYLRSNEVDDLQELR